MEIKKWAEKKFGQTKLTNHRALYIKHFINISKFVSNKRGTFKGGGWERISCSWLRLLTC